MEKTEDAILLIPELQKNLYDRKNQNIYGR